MINEIKILDRDLSLLGVIDNYTALDFRRSWQGTGDFTLTVCGYERILDIGNIIMIGNDPYKAGVIRKVQPVSDEKGVITAISGQTLNGLTSQRTLIPQENNGGYFSVPLSGSQNGESAETIIKTMISSCLGSAAAQSRQLRSSGGSLMLHTASDRHRGIITEWGCRFTQLDEELQALCEYCDCGYEIYIDFANRRYVAEYLPGTDRSVHNSGEVSRVILSKEFESVERIEYTADMTNCKNLAYCGGKGDGEDRTVISVTNGSDIPTGFDRYEAFIDCGELENVETETSVSLRRAGKHKLEEYSFIESLTAVVSQSGSFRYKEHWDLGDLVTVRDKRLDRTQDIRITEVLESYEPTKRTISVTLGKPPKDIKRAIRSIRNEVR